MDTSIMDTLSRRQFGALGVLATLAAAGCGGDERPASSGRTAVTYLTGLGATGRESFAWVAVAKGFFTEQGLDVTVQPGAAGDSNNQLLTAGRAQFASVEASGMVIRYAAGGAERTGFQIVAAIQQTTLSSLIALQSSGIREPRDLVGRKVVGVTGGAPEKLFPGYAKLAGFDNTKVTWTPAQANQINAAIAGKQADAAALFLPAEPGLRKAANGAPTVILPYAKYLPDLLGSVLITSKKLITEQPELVRGFTAGLLKGLAYTIAHPDEAAAILARAEPGLDKAIAAQEVTLMKPYVVPQDPAAQIGALDKTRIDRGLTVLQSVGLIRPGVTAADVMNDTFLPSATLAPATKPS
jgi:NitT/TauT family transport system substrate-binding protein